MKSTRASEALESEIRQNILQGKYLVGKFLPSVRKIAEEFGVASATVQRTLKELASDGLIGAEGRRGYRVKREMAAPAASTVVAHVLAMEAGEREWDPFHQMLNGAFQREAGRRGCSLLAVSAEDGQERDVIERLKSAGAWGVILDNCSPALTEMIAGAGLSAVTVDSWSEHAEMDAVVQDNYRGGYLAAEHLVSLGHRDMAWFGPVEESAASRERFGGACAALAAARLAPPQRAPELDVSAFEPKSREKALRFLDAPGHPRAVLALWTPLAVGMAMAARERGLRVGRDMAMVAWTQVETHAGLFAALLHGGPIPPAVAWSVEEMARAALGRLEARRAEPGLAPVRISIPTRLIAGGSPRT